MRVKRIIRDDPARRYIVLSAPGKRSASDEKITDQFYRAHEALQSGDASILAQIFNRYASIRDALCPSFDLEGEFLRFQRELPISRDYAASRGEYMCAKLFAAFSNMTFVDAADLIYFNEDGNLNEKAIRTAVNEKLSGLQQAVIPGFYGRDASGAIRTFSRGGSDVTGALLAAALNANLYENWTDVDGLFTADPSIVPEARRNPQVSMSQMERIAAAGAKLLHPHALGPLRGTGIETVLKNTFSPDDPGTCISESFHENVYCITGQRGLFMLNDFSVENGGIPLLYTLPVHGCIPVAVVRAFGMDAKALDLIRKNLKPIHIIHMQDHIQIIIPEKEYESTIRIVHDFLDP